MNTSDLSTFPLDMCADIRHHIDRKIDFVNAPREKMTNKAAIAEEIAALRDCDPITLRRRYHELTGADAAAFGARFMQRRCAHRLQELAFGGLSDDELSTLAYIAEHDPQINKTLRDAPRSANDSRGVTFRREYRGRIYEMRSLGNGLYEYDGKVYTSPTAVVRAITGKSHYNGVVWWGLRRPTPQGKEGEPCNA